MPDLIKTRTVLRHSHNIERGSVFDAADDDGGRLTVVTLDRSVWEEMGDPAEITVTIEPGDTLNETRDCGGLMNAPKYVNDVVAGEIVRLGTETILVPTVNPTVTITQGRDSWSNTPVAHWHAYDIVTGGSRNKVLMPDTKVEALGFIAPEVIRKLGGRCWIEALVADRLGDK